MRYASLRMRNHAGHALLLATALLAFCAGTAAQVPTAFDNTRITPANPNVGKLLELSNDTIAAANIALLDLLRLKAYEPIRGLRQDQLKIRFDITGRIDPPNVPNPEHDPHASQFLLDALLKNHFRLAAHEAQEPDNVQELVVAPVGIKFHPSTTTPDCACSGSHSVVITENHLTSSHISMSGLAARLSHELHLQIQNNTNLQGTWVIDLKWSPEAVAPAFPPGVLAPLPSPSAQPPEDFLRKALESQLGLTLQPSKRLQRVLVIDNIELPAEMSSMLPPT